MYLLLHAPMLRCFDRFDFGPTVGTSYPRRPYSFCRRHASATTPMFARRTFADAEGGRRAAVRRGQNTPQVVCRTSCRWRRFPDRDEPESLALLHHPSRGAGSPIGRRFQTRKSARPFSHCGNNGCPPLLPVSVRLPPVRVGFLLALPYVAACRSGEPLRPSPELLFVPTPYFLDNVRQCDRCGLS